jgi:DNA-binding MarR family transcriptional regulator
MAADTSLDDTQQDTWRGYLRMVRELDRHLRQHLQRECGMSVPEYELLARLSEAPGHRLPVATLAESTGWEPSRLSHQLARTGKRGLISRVTSARTRYPDAVLTEEGFALIAAAAPAHIRAVQSLFFEPLGQDGQSAVDAITRKILSGLDAHQAGDCSLRTDAPEEQGDSPTEDIDS